MVIIDKVRNILHNKGKFNEIIRFVVTGGIATIIQYAFYLLFVEIVSLPPVASTAISYCISLIFNFFMSNYFTFRTTPNIKKAIGFLSSHLTNFFLQTILVFWFAKIMDKSLALLPAMLICIPINFMLVRFSLTSRRFQ